MSFSTALMMPKWCVAEQVQPERYLWLVTLDGLRPEEVFSGADKRLIDKEIGGVENAQDTLRKFWDSDPIVRRERLLPFFWQVIAKQGQVFGSPEHGSVVLVKNGRYFSYPGYQEILCGFPDDQVDSNDKKYNENVSVLEFLVSKPKYAGQIAAFASWDVFPYILNTKRSGLEVNAGWELINVAENEATKRLLNDSIRETPHYWGSARFDFFTFNGAMQYIKVKQPRVMYLALDETDDWCHSGRYDLYLEAAQRSDHYLRKLWQYAQSSDKYRDKTAMLITTDHGRGDGRDGWKNHGIDLPGSERIWMAVIGPDTPALGIRSGIKATQGQYAASAAALLDEDFTTVSDKIAPPLPGIISSSTDEKIASTIQSRSSKPGRE